MDNRAQSTSDSLVVTLTTGQLRQLIREAVDAALGKGSDSTLLTADELAEKLKVPRSWIYEQSRQGKIPTHRIGRYIRFSLAEVIESQRSKN